MENLIKTYKNPTAEQKQQLLERGIDDMPAVRKTVSDIFDDVRRRGDEALRDYERYFDGVELDSLRVDEKEIADAESIVPEELKAALKVAYDNIYRFHAAQQAAPIAVETTKGVTCYQRSRPIGCVGLYIPGGSAPLFSTVLMLAVPAKIAGCERVILCSPPDKKGKINPAILYAANLAGVKEIYRIGGSQAIAAMAIGTETVPRVYKIFGPGNRFVMEAKLLAGSLGVAIDMPAGPSEVMIIADGSADAEFVAADLLSQAEHGPDSQVILLTTDESLATNVESEVERLLSGLPRRNLIEKSLSHSRIIIANSDKEMIEFANDYAPEHLIINHSKAMELVEQVENAGSVFIGEYACESAGDYASGTNHTLPTSGFAHAYSGVNLDSFMKKITYQTISAEGIRNLGATIVTLAKNEGLEAHALAASIRMKKAESR